MSDVRPAEDGSADRAGAQSGAPAGQGRAHVAREWRLGSAGVLRLDRPRVMGIINVTPDSFSDGGVNLSPGTAAESARRMADEGADLLDIGGESTRPGSSRVTEADQIARVVPVIGAIRAAGVEVPISIDTTRAAVAAAALDAGASVINDVSGGNDDPAMLGLAAARGCGLVLMHRLRSPDGDAYSTGYAAEPDYPGGVVPAVYSALETMRNAAEAAGVARSAIVLDPGLGFGKSVEQCVALHNATPVLLGLGCPILGAISRKSFVGAVSLGRESAPGERLIGTVAWTLAQVVLGIRVLRVHDVAQVRSALQVWERVGVPDGRVF